MSGLSVENLVVKGGGKRLVDGLSFEVREGEVVGLLGPNGAGKTTTFKALTGLLPVSSGTIRLFGEALSGPLHQRVRRGLGYLPQTTTLIEGLRVIQQVALALEARGEAPSEAVTYLEQVGIAELAERRTTDLSGGELRRVELARSLATQPRVLLLDEPFAGLAPKAIAGLRNEIRTLADSGLAILLTDHAVRDTMPICKRVVLMDQGSVVLQGSPKEVADHPIARQRWLGEDWSN